jgi:hypothetical protein
MVPVTGEMMGAPENEMITVVVAGKCPAARRDHRILAEETKVELAPVVEKRPVVAVAGTMNLRVLTEDGSGVLLRRVRERRELVLLMTTDEPLSEEELIVMEMVCDRVLRRAMVWSVEMAAEQEAETCHRRVGVSENHDLRLVDPRGGGRQFRGC